MCNLLTYKYGSKPVNVRWEVVRGDTSTLDIEFFEADETTVWNTSGWVFSASAYDPSTDTTYDLIAQDGVAGGYVYVTAPASITSEWGEGFKSIVAELQFDVQVIIPQEGEDYVWTPVVGTIAVLGDVSEGL